MNHQFCKTKCQYYVAKSFNHLFDMRERYCQLKVNENHTNPVHDIQKAANLVRVDYCKFKPPADCPWILEVSV